MSHQNLQIDTLLCHQGMFVLHRHSQSKAQSTRLSIAPYEHQILKMFLFYGDSILSLGRLIFQFHLQEGLLLNDTMVETPSNTVCIYLKTITNQIIN